MILMKAVEHGYVQTYCINGKRFSEINTEDCDSELAYEFFSDILNEIRLHNGSNVILDRKFKTVHLADVKDILRTIDSDRLMNINYYFLSRGNWQAEGIGEEIDLSVIIHGIRKERGEE